MNSYTKILILNVIIIIHLSNRNNYSIALAYKSVEMGVCYRYHKYDANASKHTITCFEGDANFCCKNETKDDYVWEECCTLDQFAQNHSGTLRFILIVSCVSGVIFFGIIVANINVIMMTCDKNQEDEDDIKSDNSDGGVVSAQALPAKYVRNTETRK